MKHRDWKIFSNILFYILVCCFHSNYPFAIALSKIYMQSIPQFALILPNHLDLIHD